MQNRLGRPGGGFRQMGYIFLAGLIIGIFIGWSMHGLVGLIVRIAIFAIAVGIVAFAINFWQSTKREQRNGTVDATWQERRDPRSR